jgi:hypothetical protein
MFGREGITAENCGLSDGNTIELGSVLEWLILEICGFYINVLVSVSVLMVNYSPFANKKLALKGL